MSRIRALILLDPEDPSAASFRAAVGADPELTSRVELIFADARNAADYIAEAEIVSCGVLSPELLARADRLRWMAFWSAGLDGKVTPELRSRGLILTNASGVHGPNIAEHILAMMLMFTRRMELHLRSQLQRKWERRMPVERPPAAELNGQTLGIIGLGRIGEALTIRAKAFGMTVMAVKRDILSRYNDTEQASPHVLLGMSELPELMRRSDHVCIALPYTPETRHLINAEVFAMMKSSAYIYNIARGAIIDESALIAALQSGAIAGVGLDVFEAEPLPETSPLWDMPNVILTPHVAGLTPHYFDRFAGIFAANLHRYLASQPMMNVYDDLRGY